MPPVIRPLAPADVPALLALGALVRTADGAALAGPVVTLESFADYLASGCSFVAILDGELVGYLLAQPLAYDGDRPLTIWADSIAVHPGYRQRRVATALYAACGVWARAVGVKGILARLPPNSLAAQVLHLRAGFRPHIADTVVWSFDHG